MKCSSFYWLFPLLSAPLFIFTLPKLIPFSHHLLIFTLPKLFPFSHHLLIFILPTLFPLSSPLLKSILQPFFPLHYHSNYYPLNWFFNLLVNIKVYFLLLIVCNSSFRAKSNFHDLVFNSAIHLLTNPIAILFPVIT